jgi:hypothetical protein
VVASPLSHERCSAVPRRGSGWIASPRGVLPRQSWIERPTAPRYELFLSPRTLPQTNLGIHAPRHHITVLPRCVLIDGEGMAENAWDFDVPYLSQRTERARRDKAGNVVVSTRRPERNPDGVPMGNFGG